MRRVTTALGASAAFVIVAALALGAPGSGAASDGSTPPSARLPDGLPPGVTVPPDAGNQAFEFGNCGARKHVTGSWTCTESADAAPARASRHVPHTLRAHAAAYYRYSFTEPRFSYWGYGQVQYGQIWWERAGNFNGSQSQFWQAGDVTDGAHTVRYDFRLEVYRSTSVGWEYRDVARNIVPAYPNCTGGRARQPTWFHPQTAGYDYHQDIWFKLRDCTVGNPDTSDGTWYSARYPTKTYHCVDSQGSCYFKGY